MIKAATAPKEVLFTFSQLKRITDCNHHKTDVLRFAQRLIEVDWFHLVSFLSEHSVTSLFITSG